MPPHFNSDKKNSHFRSLFLSLCLISEKLLFHLFSLSNFPEKISISLINFLASSGSLLSHSISYRVLNPKSVSCTSNFKPFYSYTSLTFPNPPNPTNPSTPNSSFALLKTLDFAALEIIFSGLPTQSLPINGSNGSSSSSTQLMSTMMMALTLRVMTQRGSVSENRRRRVLGMMKACRKSCRRSGSLGGGLCAVFVVPHCSL